MADQEDDRSRSRRRNVATPWIERYILIVSKSRINEGERTGSAARKHAAGYLMQKSSGDFTIKSPASGAVLPLKGYGALKGQFKVRRGIDMTKPIAAQANKKTRR